MVVIDMHSDDYISYEQFGRDFARYARICFTGVPPDRLRVGLARLAAVLSAR